MQTLRPHALENIKVDAVDHSDGLQVLSGCIICSGFLRGDALDGITDKAARCGENTLAFLENTPVLSGSEQMEKTVKRSLAVAAHEQKVQRVAGLFVNNVLDEKRTGRPYFACTQANCGYANAVFVTADSVFRDTDLAELPVVQIGNEIVESDLEVAGRGDAVADRICGSGGGQLAEQGQPERCEKFANFFHVGYLLSNIRGTMVSGALPLFL